MILKVEQNPGKTHVKYRFIDMYSIQLIVQKYFDIEVFRLGYIQSCIQHLFDTKLVIIRLAIMNLFHERYCLNNPFSIIYR